MKLLIVTQKVDKNDSVLGFFHKWIEVFSRRYENVLVICLEKGQYLLPSNVEVISLGKKYPSGMLRKIGYVLTFYKYIVRYRSSYDHVFVHMNPIYVILGALPWRIMCKKISLWYAHRSVDLKLQLATIMTHIVFTAAEESFRIRSSKVFITGHGIDTSLFMCPNSTIKNDFQNRALKLLYLGRITRIKNCDVILSAIKILKDEYHIDINMKFIGKTVYEDDINYKKMLEKFVEQYNLQNEVSFIDGIAQSDLVSEYCNSDMTINMAPTGGVDKVVLESMSCGIPVISFNRAYQSIMGKYSKNLMIDKIDSRLLAEKIKNVIHFHDISRLSTYLISQTREMDIKDVVDKIFISLNKI